MTTALLVSVALAAMAALVAAWQRSEAQASAAAEVLAQAQLAAAKREAEGEAANHADEVARLEAVVVELRALLKERDDEIERYLADDPDRAGDLLRRVLQDVPAARDGDADVLTSAGSGRGAGGGRGGGG